jgi:hypothetical protein
MGIEMMMRRWNHGRWEQEEAEGAEKRFWIFEQEATEETED